MKANGVKHVRIAPYHPASNGLAERFVQSFKTALKSSVNSRLSLSHRLANYLLSYRSIVLLVFHPHLYFFIDTLGQDLICYDLIVKPE